MFFPSPQSGGLIPCPLLVQCVSQSPHQQWSQDFRVTLYYGLLHSYQSCSFCLSPRRIFKVMEITAVDVYFSCKWSWPLYEAFWHVEVLWRQYGTMDLAFENPPVSLQAHPGKKKYRKCITWARECQLRLLSLVIQHVYTGLEVTGCPALICSLKVCSNSAKFCVQQDPFFIVNSVALYKAQLTQKSPSSFHCGEFVWLTWTSCIICMGKSFPYSKFQIAWIHVEITGFHPPTFAEQR